MPLQCLVFWQLLLLHHGFYRNTKGNGCSGCKPLRTMNSAATLKVTVAEKAVICHSNLQCNEWMVGAGVRCAF
jgi:hypothetical protein